MTLGRDQGTATASKETRVERARDATVTQTPVAWWTPGARPDHLPMTSSVPARTIHVVIVLPFLTFTGGVRVVYEHARWLLRRGHRVTLVAPRRTPGPPWTAAGRRSIRGFLSELLVESPSDTIDHYGLRHVIRTLPRLDPRYLPDADVVMATAWNTAQCVASAPQRCGRGAYFLQDYEVFEPGIESAVDATWRLPLERIVISTWLENLARERFGLPTWGPVFNGVDGEQFHARDRQDNDRSVVGMVYVRRPLKGMEDGMEAVRLARARGSDLRLRLFGRERLRHRLGPEDRFERSPPQKRIPEIYRSCDIFLSPSRREGWGLPAMEAMACGCALIATTAGGIPDFTVSGETALTTPPERPDLLAEHLVALSVDRDLRERIARAGSSIVSRFSWEVLSAQLEEILLRIASGATAGDNPPPPGNRSPES